MRYGDALFPEVETLAWVDPAGSPPGAEIAGRVPQLELEQVRSGPGQARAWSPPPPPRQVRLDHPVERPGQVVEMVLQLPSGPTDWRRLLIEDERQRVTVDSSGGAQVRIRQVEYQGRDARDLPIRDDEVASYLEPSLYVQTEDEAIEELARRLRGSERNSWRVARRLQQWVYDHMIPRSTNVRFKSSLEVMADMEGTCSEYTVLFLALCRAAGVPARAAAGFLASGTGALVLHIWAQVYVGAWIDMDPSWDQVGVDAAHIKAGQGRLTGAEARALNGPLQLLLARVDTLGLVSYTTSDAHFLAAAEEHFAAAEAAERDYAEERAQALYARIGSLPWNRRSGPAWVRIGRYHLGRKEVAEARAALEEVLRRAPTDPAAAAALYYLGRAAEAGGDEPAAMERLAQLLADHPDGDLADDGLARLAQLTEKRRGCAAARPLYERLCREYGDSGWVDAAVSALARCGGGQVDGTH